MSGTLRQLRAVLAETLRMFLRDPVDMLAVAVLRLVGDRDGAQRRLARILRER